MLRLGEEQRRGVGFSTWHTRRGLLRRAFSAQCFCGGGNTTCLKGRLVSLPHKGLSIGTWLCGFATGFAHAVRQFFEDPSLEVWEERAFCQGLADPEERFR